MKKALVLSLLLVAVAGTPPAHAVPGLQLYIEGAIWDAANETWVTGDNEFDLWVLGDVESWGTIFDVKLATSGYGSGTINLTPKTTSLVTDPSTPAAPVLRDPATVDVPSGVADHDPYKFADDHLFYGLGDFTLTDSPIGDYTQSVPVDFPTNGQINVYHVAITGYSAVHFDAFDHVVLNQTKVVFAPFSHDAGYGPGIPEPGTLALLGMGLAAGTLRRRRRKPQ